MNGLPARPFVVRAAHRLAVDGHHLSGQQVRHRLAPFHKAFLEAVRVQSREHVAESVVGRDAVSEFQESAEPLLLALAEHLHVNPRIRTADNGADGYCDDVQQLVPLAPLYPRILQISEILHNRRTPPPLHNSLRSSLTLPISSQAKSIIYNAIALGLCLSCGQCNIFSIVSGAASGRNSVVECLLPKQDVVGSNPIARSNRLLLILPRELRPGLASFVFEYSLPVSWPCGKLAAILNWPSHYQGVLHGLRHPPRGRGPGEFGQSLSGIGPAFRDTA